MVLFWTALPVLALLVTLLIADKARKVFWERIESERLGLREVVNLIFREFRLSGDMIPKILAVTFASLLFRLAICCLATGYRPALGWPWVGRTWLVMAYSWALGPVVEELTYRGVVFRLLQERFRLPAALVVSSVLFAAYHPVLGYGVCPWLYLFSVFTAGIGLGALYVWTGSLASVVLAHAATNFFASCLV